MLIIFGRDLNEGHVEGEVPTAESLLMVGGKN
jgi:hypothetical protein